MASYYYLISSLPSLKDDSPMPFDYKSFLAMCRSSVNDSVYKRLEELSLKSCNGPLLKDWGLFYSRLNRELCRQRLLMMGKKPSSESDRDSAIEKIVDETLKAENPLEAEKVLLSYQFDYLDSLVSMHYFDEYVLYGYAVKLKLLERQQLFVQEKGKKEFKRLFDGIQLQILNI